jgi:cytidylate kinase
MIASEIGGVENRLRPVLASLKANPMIHGIGLPHVAVTPFVTITRQPFAGGWSLAQRLVESLNQSQPLEEETWTCWDRELIEKVATDHHISQRLIESLEDSYRSWLSDLVGSFSGFYGPGEADELRVYRRVAQTVRALAKAGRVVVVGRGGIFITRGMPGGLHIRLVAPLDDRIRSASEHLGLSLKEAALEVRRIDANRLAFYARYWPGKTLDPEAFDAIFNTARLSEDALAETLAHMIHLRQRAAESVHA